MSLNMELYVLRKKVRTFFDKKREEFRKKREAAREKRAKFKKAKPEKKKKESPKPAPVRKTKLGAKKKQVSLKKIFKIQDIHKRAGRSRQFLEKAGLSINHKKVTKRLFDVTIFLNFLISGYLIYYFSISAGYTIFTVFFSLALVWFVLFTFILFIVWFLFYMFLDLRIFQRGRGIELVLPDFLELTAANINAGMTIDKALWYAVRPRFGVLANEIEIVAKQTMSGMELEEALNNFAAKYDSVVLKRSISLLIEGIQAGGEIGQLLNRISTDIKESQILKKEMAANISNYAIFISFASIAGAPFLLALAGQLIRVIVSILQDVELPETSGFLFAISASVSPKDFTIFAIATLVVTSLFSSMIVAIIKRGDVKSGPKYIPAFMTATLLVYFIASKIMATAFSAFI